MVTTLLLLSAIQQARAVCTFPRPCYDDVLVGAYSNDDRGHDAGTAYLLLRGGL